VSKAALSVEARQSISQAGCKHYLPLIPISWFSFSNDGLNMATRGTAVAGGNRGLRFDMSHMLV
jgi:hypothetical protein